MRKMSTGAKLHLMSIILLQAMADIFNKPVYVIDEKNSAPLGGCFRAKLGNLSHK